MKKITQFRALPEGLFLDLVDKPSSVFIDADTGMVHLNEGKGFNRLDGMILDSSMDVLFWVEEMDGEKWKLLLHLDRVRVHNLGSTRDLKAAVSWATSANSSVRKKHVPAKLSDLTKAEQELLARLKGKS